MAVKKRADEVKPSDTILFLGASYKVRSVVVKHDHVQFTYWDTNDEHPYHYDRDQLMEVQE